MVVKMEMDSGLGQAGWGWEQGGQGDSLGVLGVGEWLPGCPGDGWSVRPAGTC